MGRGDRQDRIVGEMRLLREQGKVLAAVVVVLVHRADDALDLDTTERALYVTHLAVDLVMCT